MFYLMTHTTHFISDYMVKDHSDSKKGYSFQLAARVLLYASASIGQEKLKLQPNKNQIPNEQN